MVELRHPKTKNGKLFAMNDDKSEVAEVICIDDPHSAWFIGDTVGKIYKSSFLINIYSILNDVSYLLLLSVPMNASYTS